MTIRQMLEAHPILFAVCVYPIIIVVAALVVTALFRFGVLAP